MPKECSSSVAEAEEKSPSRPKKLAKKKSSSKPPTLKPEDPVVEEEKQTSSTPKSTGNEIDEIFYERKRKKSEKENATKATEYEAGKLDKMMKKKKKKKKNKVPEESGFVDPPARMRKRTSDGFTIYSEEELGIGQANAGAVVLLQEQSKLGTSLISLFIALKALIQASFQL